MVSQFKFNVTEGRNVNVNVTIADVTNVNVTNVNIAEHHIKVSSEENGTGEGGIKIIH